MNLDVVDLMQAIVVECSREGRTLPSVQLCYEVQPAGGHYWAAGAEWTEGSGDASRVATEKTPVGTLLALLEAVKR